MRIGVFFREHMWVRTLTTLSLVILLVMGAMIALGIKSQNEMIRDQVNHQGEILAEAIQGEMNDALSIGNNDMVRQQFMRLKARIPDIDVAVCNFDQTISFATDLNLIKKPLGAMVKSATNAKAITRTIADPQLRTEPFGEEVDGSANISVFRPILNEPRCYHCHGSSRKVLGGILVRASATKAFDAVRTVRNWGILVGVIGLVFVVFITYLLFRRLVAHIQSMVTNVTETSITLTGASGDLTRTSDHLASKADEMSGRSRAAASATEQASASISSMAAASQQVSAQITSVASASDAISVNMREIGTSTELVSSNLNMVACAAEEMSASVNTVAAAIEEMYSSLNEVARVRPGAPV